MQLLTAVKIEPVASEPIIVGSEVEVVHPFLMPQATLTRQSMPVSKNAMPKKPGKRLIKQIIRHIEAL